MPAPFLSEIRLFSFGHPPKGWAFCNGQILQISQNQALFALLGTQYGGNGQTTFALPDLRARVPMHTHSLSGRNANGSTPQAAGNVLAGANNLYAAPSGGLTTMEPGSVSNIGGSQAHQNMQPYMVMNYCISLQGIFPSQSGSAGGGSYDPYVGEVRMVASNWTIAGWEMCNGQLVPIAENETLFQLIGTTYGGDGEETFALPNLQSRVAIHQKTDPGDQWPMGQMAGVEEVTLTANQIPSHTHPLTATQAVGNQIDPGGSVLAQTAGGLQPYFENPPSVQMSPQSIAPTGGSQPHTNMQQFLTVNYQVSMYGIFPSPT